MYFQMAILWSVSTEKNGIWPLFKLSFFSIMQLITQTFVFADNVLHDDKGSEQPLSASFWIDIVPTQK